MDTHYVFKTKPGIAGICIGIIGFIFFGSIALYLINSKLISNESTENFDIVKFILTGTFSLFSFGGLWLLVNIKVLTLTDKKLMIKKPLLFYTKTISLSQIKSIRQFDDPIKISRNFTTTTVYTGKKATIELASGDKIKFSSMEISDYAVLIKKINETIRHLRFNHSDTDES